MSDKAQQPAAPNDRGQDPDDGTDTPHTPRLLWTGTGCSPVVVDDQEKPEGLRLLEAFDCPEVSCFPSLGRH